jgi:hypothetical protein
MAGDPSWPRYVSVSATTMVDVTLWTPIGIDGMTRERRPTVATTLVVAGATTAIRTRAQALIYWGPRLLAGTSSTWLSRRGIDCQQTSQSTLGKRTPNYGLRITSSLVKPAGQIATTSSSTTSPCSWLTLHEHGWSTFCPTGFKFGRT